MKLEIVSSPMPSRATQKHAGPPASNEQARTLKSKILAPTSIFPSIVDSVKTNPTIPGGFTVHFFQIRYFLSRKCARCTPGCQSRGSKIEEGRRPDSAQDAVISGGEPAEGRGHQPGVSPSAPGRYPRNAAPT